MDKIPKAPLPLPTICKATIKHVYMYMYLHTYLYWSQPDVHVFNADRHANRAAFGLLPQDHEVTLDFAGSVLMPDEDGGPFSASQNPKSEFFTTQLAREFFMWCF